MPDAPQNGRRVKIKCRFAGRASRKELPKHRNRQSQLDDGIVRGALKHVASNRIQHEGRNRGP
ncbi:MAG: hypothetical protein KAI41_00310, partial [Hyphomicrobiaceae bacterium]|nr:hypothetical protein [Hyphomicrobiaceae bacterium]